MFLQSKPLYGKIEAKNMNNKLFKNVIQGNVYNTCIGLECNNQDELDELMELLNINKYILAEHNMHYNKLLKDLMLTKSVYFDIIISTGGNFTLIY